MDAERAAPDDASIVFIFELARALVRHGIPARQLERTLTRAGERLGCEIAVFATLTAVIVSIGTPTRAHTLLLRFEPTALDISAVTRLDEVLHDFLNGQGSTVDMRTALDQLEHTSRAAAPRSWQRLTIAACGAASWALLLHGGWRELLASACVASLLEWLAMASEQRAAFRAEFTVIAGLVSGACMSLWAAQFPPMAAEVAAVAVLIPLLPGMALVTAAEELASNDLVTGTARLTTAALVFAQLMFGVAIGSQFARILPEPGAHAAPVAWPLVVQLSALVPAATWLAVRMHAGRSDLALVWSSTLLGYVSWRFASALFGAEIGAFVAAFLVGIVGNASARRYGRPALTRVVPGILVLVPGSLGYRSAEALWATETVTGLRVAVSVLFVSIAIATGLMFANSLVPSRRVL